MIYWLVYIIVLDQFIIINIYLPYPLVFYYSCVAYIVFGDRICFSNLYSIRFILEKLICG